MTMRTLPALNGLNIRAGMPFEPSPDAMARWNSGIQAAAADQNDVVSILDVIGEDFIGNGFTAKRMSGALRSIGPKPITVHVNSPGGDVFEGIAIYNLLREHQAEVTIKILGLAASIASVIAMAGDEIQIAASGFIMMHKAQGVAVGDEDDFRAFADLMKPINRAMAEVYAARSGKAVTELLGWMKGDGTWLGGEEAIAEQFADALLPADQVAKDQPTPRDVPMRAYRRVDAMLAKTGVTRAERKELFRDLRGMPGAAPSVMPGADGLPDGLEAALATLRSIKP